MVDAKKIGRAESPLRGSRPQRLGALIQVIAQHQIDPTDPRRGSGAEGVFAEDADVVVAVRDQVFG